MLAVAPGDDITFIVHQEQVVKDDKHCSVGSFFFVFIQCEILQVIIPAPQGDTSSTKYQVDLGDGVRAIYQNLTVTDEPIQHRYEKPGIYKVTVKAENMAGHDEATMYIQVTG